MSCEHEERLYGHAIGALPPDQGAALEAHTAACSECRALLESLRATVAAFASWPVDVLRPSAPLWERLARRIGADGDLSSVEPSTYAAPEWSDVGPGISCKLLANDAESGVVSMLVRLAPGAAYPPHTHAGSEELHLLSGELWIDGMRLSPGDCNRADAGTSDARVWSETGCTCVLITSSRDVLR